MVNKTLVPVVRDEFIEDCLNSLPYNLKYLEELLKVNPDWAIAPSGVPSDVSI
jgi:hypothetical protein